MKTYKITFRSGGERRSFFMMGTRAGARKWAAREILYFGARVGSFTIRLAERKTQQ